MTPAILGIETSCDDTAAAVVTEDLAILSSVVSSQMDAHARYGGIVPEIASRIHTSEITSVISKAMADAGATPEDLAAIAVTRGPGLVGSLLVGVSTAKALALVWKKPVVAVNHLVGHLVSASLTPEPVAYPCLFLLVSGGHSLLASAPAPGDVEVLGGTRDDSAGEAYDKVARLLGLGFPGGPAIDRLAQEGEATIDFPRPLLQEGLDFSFSGLKSAVAQYVRHNPGYDTAQVAASFATAVMDLLLTKLERALETGEYRSMAVVGGVAASPILRPRLQEMAASRGLQLCLPPPRLATDNAAMIAAAGWRRLRERGGDPLDFSVDAGLALG